VECCLIFAADLNSNYLHFFNRRKSSEPPRQRVSATWKSAWKKICLWTREDIRDSEEKMTHLRFSSAPMRSITWGRSSISVWVGCALSICLRKHRRGDVPRSKFSAPTDVSSMWTNCRATLSTMSKFLKTPGTNSVPGAVAFSSIT